MNMLLWIVQVLAALMYAASCAGRQDSPSRLPCC